MKRLTGFILGACLAPLVLAEGTDSLWELTTRMEMPGMPPEMKGMKIPGMGSAQTQTMCLAENKKYESEKQKDCKVLDQSQSGRLTKLTVQCKDGTMKIEREDISKDHWRSKMEMTSSRRGSEGEMTMFQEARRIGPCDNNKEGNMSRETQKVLGDVKEQAAANAAMMGTECERAANDWPASAQPFAAYEQQAKARKDAIAKAKGRKDSLRMVDVMTPEIPGCAKAKADYCAKSKVAFAELSSRAGYAAVMKRGKSSGALSAAFTACGSGSLAPITARHCKAAVGDADYAFIGTYCPAERKELAVQYCSGRSYTAIEPKYRALCGSGSGGDDYGPTGAAQEAEKGDTAAGKERSGKDVAADVVEGGVKKLKGLFGF